MKIRGLFALVIAATGCGEPIDEGVEDTTAAVTGTRTDRSLVVTDPTILARFSFTRTIDALRATAVSQGQTLATSESRLAIYRRWMRSFAEGTDGCDRATIDPNGYGFECPRSAEAKLATTNPFLTTSNVRFVPVGLFNRFDLMPSTGATCGEYRVVYAMQADAGAPLTGRAFIIFEAALPNPDPALGVEGCLPVAQFWQSLTNDASVTSRAAKLERFYFTGTAVPGFGAVIRAQNLGLATPNGAAIAGRPGQVRTNFFVDFAEWHLREFKLRTSCPTTSTCQLLFEQATVKTNPAEELFDGSHARAPAFQAAFIGQVRRLASSDVNKIAMGVNNNFNEFESVSQRSDTVYRLSASGTFRTAIQAELTRLRSPLSVDNILDRATTQTCAGCHQLSNGAALGGGLTWPRSSGFVMIDESGRLAQALTNVFLPARLANLEKFITDRELGAPIAAAPDETITGRPADAPN